MQKITIFYRNIDEAAIVSVKSRVDIDGFQVDRRLNLTIERNDIAAKNALAE